MNSVSWMLYAADVAGGLSTVCSLLSIGAAVCGAVAVVSASIKIDVDNIFKTEKRPCLQDGWTVGRGFFLLAIPCALVASVIPSKDTIYAIAASESVEQVAKSETGQKAVKALNAWLDKQIAPAKEGAQ